MNFWADTDLAFNRRSKKKVKGEPKNIKDLIPPEYELLPFVTMEGAEIYARATRIPKFQQELVFDIECYLNYSCIAFRHIETQKVIVFEDTPDSMYSREMLEFVLMNFKLISFNGKKYDVPMLHMMMRRTKAEMLCYISTKLVGKDSEYDTPDGGNSYTVFKFAEEYDIRWMAINHIDTFDVAPLKASLKLYAARLHCKRMQELPFEPGTALSKEQAKIVLYYCVNDLANTELLYSDLRKQIKLREQLSDEYGIDLRSRSDAQIAEHVIAHEMERMTGIRPEKPTVAAGTTFYYSAPSFIFFSSPSMRAMYEELKRSPIVVAESGRPKCTFLNGLKMTIGNGIYRMGVGGLHSSESCRALIADDEWMLIDRDVASFYPMIILNLGLFPKHLGPRFLDVYRSLVNRRLEAKGLSKSSDLEIADINKIIADSIKITINGSFGKLGSKYSKLFSPDLLITVTLTGQLVLLMLIEELERIGISVVSANTDGIVIRCHKTRYEDLCMTIKAWEQHTNFETEETQYRALYNRDVNNYIALKKHFDKKTKLWVDVFPTGAKADDRAKGKGVFSEADIWKNPANTICVESLLAFLDKGEDMTEAIIRCDDIRKFVTVRTVQGGAYQEDRFIGKAIRWYYAKEWHKTINYIKSGNKVPKSEGAKPCMILPDSVPSDLNRDWYINETNALLRDVGYFGKGYAREIEEIELFDVV